MILSKKKKIFISIFSFVLILITCILSFSFSTKKASAEEDDELHYFVSFNGLVDKTTAWYGSNGYSWYIPSLYQGYLSSASWNEIASYKTDTSFDVLDFEFMAKSDECFQIVIYDNINLEHSFAFEYYSYKLSFYTIQTDDVLCSYFYDSLNLDYNLFKISLKDNLVSFYFNGLTYNFSLSFNFDYFPIISINNKFLEKNLFLSISSDEFDLKKSEIESSYLNYLNQHNITMTSDIENLQNQIDTLTSDKNTLNSKILESDKSIDSLSAEKSELQSQVDILEDENTSLRIQNKELTSNNTSTVQTISIVVGSLILLIILCAILSVIKKRKRKIKNRL